MLRLQESFLRVQQCFLEVTSAEEESGCIDTPLSGTSRILFFTDEITLERMSEGEQAGKQASRAAVV